jgi:hypothetical protein
MGRRCVIEDTDQNVDHKEKPNFGKKKPYISGDSLVRAAPGSERSHLSSPSLSTLELLRDLTVGKDSAAPQRPPSVPFSAIETSPAPFSRIAGMSPYDVLTCRTTLSLMRLDRDAAAWAPRHRRPGGTPCWSGHRERECPERNLLYARQSCGHRAGKWSGTRPPEPAIRSLTCYFFRSPERI